MLRAPAPSLATLLSALAFLAAPAAAQDRDEMVPRALLAALVEIGPEPGEILLGRLPTGFPAGLAPPGARVVGSVVRHHFSTAVLALPGPPGEVADAYQRRLEGQGWTAPPTPTTGFLESRSRQPRVLCGTDSTAVLFQARAREGGGSYLNLVRLDSSPCRRPDPVMSGRAPRPALTPPEGARYGGGGGSESSPGYEATQMTLHTEMAPAQLVAHYAAQLQGAGWTPGPASPGEDVAAQSFRHRDAEGRSWHAVLEALAIPESDRRDVVFRVYQVPPPGRDGA